MSKIPPPPVNQPVLNPKAADLTPHWKQWFVDLHKLVDAQAKEIEDLKSTSKTTG